MNKPARMLPGMVLEFWPAYAVPEAQGFYDLHEEVFELRVKTSQRLAAILQARQLSLDLDEAGRLAYLEVTRPRGLWEVSARHQPPAEYCRAEASFGLLPVFLPAPKFYTDLDRTCLCVEFSAQAGWRSVEVAKQVIVDIDRHYRLLRVWVLGIEEDFSFRKRLAWSQK